MRTVYGAHTYTAHISYNTHAYIMHISYNKHIYTMDTSYNTQVYNIHISYDTYTRIHTLVYIHTPCKYHTTHTHIHN